MFQNKSRYLWLLTTFLAGLATVGVSPAQDSIELSNALLKIVETVNVPAETSGALAELNVREGDVVSAGALLARVRGDEAKLKREEANLAFQMARAQADNDIDVRYAVKSHEVAVAELRRAGEANNRVQDTISQSEMDRRQLVQERTKLEIEQAETNRQINEFNVLLKQNVVRQHDIFIRRHEVVAPISGMVVAVNRRLGEWVNVSDDVARIVRIDRLRVEDLMPVTQATLDLVGRPVTFYPELPQLANQSFQGQVVFVSPEANPVNSKVRVWAEIDNDQFRLRPGLKGRLTIHSKDKKSDQRKQESGTPDTWRP